MQEMTVTEALKLVRTNAAPSISLYVDTNVTERDGPSKISANLQRLYRTVEAMVSKTYDARTRERLLIPLKKALGALRLNRSKGGLAIYHTERFTGVVRLPTHVKDMAVAADSFHLKPVLRCAQLRQSYYIVAMRKRAADIILVTADEAKKVGRIAMKIKEHRSTPDDEKSRRWLKDGLKMRRQKDLKDAMAALNRQLSQYLKGERQPLLLAGPHQYQESFRAHCSYPNLVDRGIDACVDEMDIKTITTMSEGLMEQYFAQIDAHALRSFYRAQSLGLASTSLTKVSAAAARGQVQSLLIAEDYNVWGLLDRTTGSLRVLEQRTDATADDLLDDIAEMTLLKGGKVTVLPSAQMPEKAPIAAILRWNDTAVDARKPPFHIPIDRLPRREFNIDLAT